MNNDIPLSVRMSTDLEVPDGYYKLSPEDVSIPGKDIYRNSRGTWSQSMSAGKVGVWTTFARKKKEKNDLHIDQNVPSTRRAVRRDGVTEVSKDDVVPPRRARLRE